VNIEALNRENRSSLESFVNSEAQQIFHISGFLVAMTEVQGKVKSTSWSSPLANFSPILVGDKITFLAEFL